MSFRKIGGINRSSNNHIVTSEYAASSKLVSKEIGGDYSDDTVIIYNSDICGNINVSVDKNILARGTLTIYDDISGFSTLDISDDITGHSNLLIHKNITGYQEMDISGHIRGHDDLTIFGDISGHGTLDITSQITGHDTLTIHSDISGFSTLEITGDITGHNNLLIHKDISGNGLLDICGNITGYSQQTIHGNMLGLSDLEVSGVIRGRTRLLIDDHSDPKLDVSNIVYSHTHIHGESTMEIMGDISGQSNLFIENDITGHGTLDISGDMTGYSNLTIYEDISGFGTLDISGELRGHSRLLVNNDSELKLDVSNIVHSHTHIQGDKTLDISDNITGHSNLTIYQDISGYGTLDISGLVIAQSGIVIEGNNKLDVSNGLVHTNELQLDGHFQANDISCSNIEVKSGSNIVLQNGNIDVSGDGYVHIRGENSEGNGLVVEKNVLIEGNLTVNMGKFKVEGEETIIHTTNLDVSDNIIEMHRLDDMAAGIIITNDSSGAVDDRKVFIGYNPSTTIGTSGVTQDAIIFTKIADTDISDNNLTDELKNDDNNLMWLKARGIDVQNFVVKEQSATVSEVQGLQHLHQTIIDGGLSANGQTVLNSTNIYNKLSFYELPDASDVFGKFFDASGNPPKVLETNNNYYFIYDVSGEYRLQINTGFNSASDSTSVGYIEYDYIVCGGGADGSLNGLTAYGGDISFNYDNIDEHGIRDDATTYINVGGAGQNTKIDISYNTDSRNFNIVDVSGGTNDTSYNTQFEYAYDSYQFPDRANFKIQLGHTGDTSYNFGIKLNYEDQELDYSNNVIDYSNTDISLNGFYGSGAKPGGIGGDGVAVLIFKKENFVKMMVDRLHTYKYQEITHNTAFLIDVDVSNHLYANEVSFNYLDVSNHLYANEVSFNILDVSNHLFANEVSFNILDVSNHLYANDVSFNYLDVSNHLYVNEVSFNYLDVSNHLYANEVSFNHLDVSNHLYANEVSFNYLDVSNHIYANEVSFNILDVSNHLYANEVSFNHLDVSNHLYANEVSFNHLDVSNHLYANEVSFNHLDVSNHLYANEVSFNHLDVSNHLYANEVSFNDLDVLNHLYANEVSFNHLDVSNHLFANEVSFNILDVSNHLYANEVSFNILDVSNHLFANEVSFNYLDVFNHLYANEVSFNYLDISNDLRVQTHALIEDVSINNSLTANKINVAILNIGDSTFSSGAINFASDATLNANDVSINTLFVGADASINNHLYANDVSINHLDITSHLFAPDVSFTNLDISNHLYANDASINHLDVLTHLFAPDASINTLDVSNHLYVNDASTNNIDVSNHLYANDVSINKLNVSENLTVNGVAIFNDIVRANNIDISSQILGINSGEASGNIGLMMQTETDTSNVFFGYDISENMCFITKTSYGPDTSFNVYDTLEQDNSTNLVNNLVNLQVNTLKAQNLECADFTVTTNNFNQITVNDNASMKNLTVQEKATIKNVSVEENINCGKAIKLENNTFSVGSMVNVYKDASDAILETDYDIYVTDKWAIYVFDNSGNYSMNLNVLEEDGIVPDISLGYIICGGGEGGGDATSNISDLNYGYGGAPGYVKYDYNTINGRNITISMSVGSGGEASGDNKTRNKGGEPGYLSSVNINGIVYDSSGGLNDVDLPSDYVDNNYNSSLNFIPIDDNFEIKLGGRGGYGNNLEYPNYFDASFGGGGGGGSIDISNNGIAGKWGIKGTKKGINGELIMTDFIDGSNGTPYLDPSGGNGGNGYYGGGGGGGGIGNSSLNLGVGGRGGDGVVCIIIDKAKFGSVIKDVEEIQCGTLDAFQIETTKLKTKSDYRLKTNVEDLQEVYNVDNLRPVMYNINSSKEIGLIAHEIQEYFPFLVSGVKDGKEMQTVNYTGLIGVLIKEIQLLKSVVREQSELVREQGNKIHLLENGNN